MSVTSMVTLGYCAAIDSQPELHQAWIKQSFQLSGIAGVAHLATLQSSHRLDLLLRQLEAEYEPAPDGLVDFSLDMRLSLSECWVLRVYEVIRAAAAQLRAKRETHDKLAALKHRLGLVRMPIAKGEIQQSNKATTPIVLVHEDGSDPKEYVNDGSYIVPRQICTDTGSPMWCPVNITTGESSQIRRIDLSNELLGLFE